MKLSEYLYEKIYAESRKMFDSIEEELLECEPLSANTIEKWIKEGSKGTLTFVVFNYDCSWGWFTDGSTVKDSEIVHIDNKYKSNEPFFKINIEDTEKVDMNISNPSEEKSKDDPDLDNNSKHPS